MIACPKCGKQIDANYGVTTCPMCEFVFIYNYDGSVQSSTDEVETYAEDSQHVEVDTQDDSENESFASMEDVPDTGADPEAISQHPADAEPEAFEMVSEEAQGDYSENFLDQLSAGTPKVDDKLEGIDPLGVVKFDQSETSQLTEGLYYYDIFISGLDTVQIRQLVFTALSDKRLALPIDELKKKIKAGDLIIETVNPVRAVLIVLKLQDMDVQVEWRQKLFSDDKPNELAETEIQENEDLA